MRRSFNRLSCFLLVCSFLLHPIGSFVSPSIRPRVNQKEYLIGAGGRVCSSLFGKQRNTREGDRSAVRPRSNNKSDAIALNKKITQLGKERKWKEILQLAEKEKSQFNNVNWATSFSQLGRIRSLDRRDPLLRSFVKDYAACLESRGLQWAGIREVANVVHAIGKMRLKNQDTKLILLVVSTKDNACKIVQKGMPQEVANVAWSFATLGVKSPKLFTAIETRADWFVTNGKPQEVANTAWAFATLDVKASKIFAAIENRADWLMTDGTPQAVANVAWAYATMDVKSPKLLTAIKTRADWLVINGTPQANANTAWAFATLDVKAPKLFAAIETRADWLVTNGKPQAVANTAWAFATMDVKASNLFATIEKRADWLVTNGNPQDVANTAWAFATMDVKAPELFAAIETSADWLVTNGTPQAVANTIWAANQLQYYSPNLIQKANLRGAWLVEDGITQGISNSAIAFAKVGYDASTFFTAVTNNISKLINDGNPQQIVNICYAMAILDLGKKHSHAFGQLWNAAITLDNAVLSNEALIQIAQVYSFCTANGMKLQQPSAFLKQKIRDVVLDSTQSNYQQEVATFLGQIGLDYEEEVSPLEGSEIDNGMLLIDFACKNHMLAIECDGESHFLRELGTGKTTQEENGATRAKRRFLQQTGWNVVNIGYQDWIDARKKKSRLEFLRGKLNEVGMQLK